MHTFINILIMILIIILLLTLVYFLFIKKKNIHKQSNLHMIDQLPIQDWIISFKIWSQKRKDAIKKRIYVLITKIGLSSTLSNNLTNCITDSFIDNFHYYRVNEILLRLESGGNMGPDFYKIYKECLTKYSKDISNELKCDFTNALKKQDMMYSMYDIFHKC